MRNITRRSLLSRFKADLSPTGLCARCRDLYVGGTGRLSAGRLTCLDAVLQGGLEPDGEVMLAAHLVLLLPELHLLPVLVGGPFAHRFASESASVGEGLMWTTRTLCILDYKAGRTGPKDAAPGRSPPQSPPQRPLFGAARRRSRHLACDASLGGWRPRSSALWCTLVLSSQTPPHH